MKQATLDRIRVINKHVTNKILIHISGKKFGHIAILSHVGRKSGKLYRIPIIAEPIKNGFVIALTYGKKVDWYENVKHKEVVLSTGRTKNTTSLILNSLLKRLE